jgi:hypothetical protein
MVVCGAAVLASAVEVARMAESMVIYFSRATWDEITAALNAVAEAGDGLLWYFPSNSDYSVTAYAYDEIFDEYAEDERDSIFGRLGGVPSATLCLELRRSKGDIACDAASSLTTQLLKRFAGLADTLFGPGGAQLWTLEEITSGAYKDGLRFLDEYRVESSRTEDRPTC